MASSDSEGLGKQPQQPASQRTAVTAWTNNFFQRTGSFDQGQGEGGLTGMANEGQRPPQDDEGFRGRSSSWSTWSRDILWPARTSASRRQRGISESSDTSSTISGQEVTIHSRTKSTSVLPSPLVRHSSGGGGSGRRHNSGGSACIVESVKEVVPPPASPADPTPVGQENLSFGASDQVVYDIDGKFPYSVYESKPTFYDIDGIHRYKHFKAFKPTPYTSGAPHHEKRPVCYDLDGKVTCFTVRDIHNHRMTTRPAAAGAAAAGAHHTTSLLARAQSLDK